MPLAATRSNEALHCRHAHITMYLAMPGKAAGLCTIMYDRIVILYIYYIINRIHMYMYMYMYILYIYICMHIRT